MLSIRQLSSRVSHLSRNTYYHIRKIILRHVSVKMESLSRTVEIFTDKFKYW